MKKIIALLICASFLFCFVSCSDGSESAEATLTTTDIIESISSVLIDSVTGITSENTLCSEPTAPDGFSFNALILARPSAAQGENTKLSYEDSVFIRDILDNGKWEEGTADCLSDILFIVDGKEIYYHSSCGTINDHKNNRYIHLTKNQIEKINDALGPLVMLIGEETGGVQLSVEIKSPVIYGKNFVLTAKATNLTGETIYVTLPTGTPNSHCEIRVEIKDESGRRFVDLDTQGKEFNEEVKIFSVEHGETVTQVMNMAPGYLIDGSTYPWGGEEIIYFPSGNYKGTATFYWHDSFNPETFEYSGEQHKKTIEFEIPVKATGMQ